MMEKTPTMLQLGYDFVGQAVTRVQKVKLTAEDGKTEKRSIPGTSPSCLLIMGEDVIRMNPDTKK